ncbi:MAG: alpha/beta hydrolase [Clostridia bacterium]|nr:alpha/beta hydrolase [Clostridia bacterium]
MNTAVIYIHGKGGNPEEAARYQKFFPESAVSGFDYTSRTPWEAKEEFPRYFDALLCVYKSVTIIANSIGAYFAMCALSDRQIERAYFISPIVDMEKLIADMMAQENVTEEELRKKGRIETESGETLSWDYLVYVREHPPEWAVPTDILYGSRDNLTSVNTITAFAKAHHADLTVMEDGEHWFHTEEQMRFLDDWIKIKADNQAIVPNYK